MIFNELNMIERIYASTALIAGISSFCLGFFVYFKDKKKALNRSYFLMSFTTGLWSFLLFFCHTSSNITTALFLNRYLHIAAIFIPVTFFHFILNLIGIARKKRKILFLGYAFCLALASFALSPVFIKAMEPKFSFRVWPTAGPAYLVFLFLFFMYITYSWILAFDAYRKTSGAKKMQLKYILLGMTFGFAGGSTNYAYFYNIPIPPVGNFFVFSYVVLYAYAIIQHRLMGIEVLLKRGFWLITSFIAALAVGYGIFSLSDTILNVSGRASAGMASIGMLVTFAFLMWRVYITQFKPADMRLNALKESSLEMVVFPDPIRLSREICGRVFNTFDPTYAHVYLIEKANEKYSLQHVMGESDTLKKKLTKKDPVVKWFMDVAPILRKKKLVSDKESNILFYHDVTEDWLLNRDFTRLDSKVEPALLAVKKQLEDLKANLVVASLYKRRLYGLLVLGEKKSGFYTPEDLEVLSSLSTIAAMNIRNALTITDLHTKVRDKTKLIKEMHDRTIQMVFSFNKAIDARDPYTADHSIEVREIGGWIAEEMGIEMTEELSFALQLHDVGKIGVPDRVLLKEGRLNDEEFKKIKQHPKIGYDILSSMDFFKKIAEIAYCHQEKYDGTGYPRKLKGEEIPVEARIVAVADAYHAMTSDRPYRDKMPMADVARELLKCRNKQFDPDVIDALIRRLIKVRSITKRQVKHIASEEALIPFNEVDFFLKRLLEDKTKK